MIFSKEVYGMATNYLTNESGKFVSASADSNEIDVLNLAQVDRFVVEFSKKFSQDYISLYGANENFIFDGAGSATYNIQGGKNNVIAMSDGNDTVIDASTGTIIIQNGAKGTKTFFAGSSIQIVSSDPYTKHSQDDDLIVNFYEDEKVISSYVFKNGVNSSNSPKISATEKCLSNPDTETGEEEQEERSGHQVFSSADDGAGTEHY